jgi:glycosyltransferase involved in cell wall biosynthesis
MDNPVMPTVSIVVPCYNEQSTIRLLLDALYGQTYPRPEMEVVIADGLSTDLTREQIAAFQVEHADINVRVVDNRERTIPAGLNYAIAAAQGRFIVRLDAHSAPDPDYVARCVADLLQGRGDVVGGLWEIKPRGKTWQARSIVVAAAHPLGVGDVRYRLGGYSQLVDTVPFGAFLRTLVERIGPFDETLLTNEDYEFNTRVRQSGGAVWFDPEIRSTYFASPTLVSLARQYWRYGFWKVRMLRRHPSSLRWRQALPPVFVLSLLALSGLAIWFPLARTLLVTEGLLYILALLVVGVQSVIIKRDLALVIGVPLAIAVMHVAWGSAFLWSWLG